MIRLALLLAGSIAQQYPFALVRDESSSGIQWQKDGHGPHQAAGKPALGKHRAHRRAVHEPGQWRIGAHGDLFAIHEVFDTDRQPAQARQSLPQTLIRMTIDQHLAVGLDQ